MQKFWIVWVPSHGLPKVQHETLEVAKTEASRIASKEKQSAYVFELVGVVTPLDPPTVWVPCENAGLGGRQTGDNHE